MKSKNLILNFAYTFLKHLVLESMFLFLNILQNIYFSVIYKQFLIHKTNLIFYAINFLKEKYKHVHIYLRMCVSVTLSTPAFTGSLV